MGDRRARDDLVRPQGCTHEVFFSCDRSKLSMGPVRTHYIIEDCSDNLCISPKIEHNQALEVKSDEIYTR